MDKAAFKSYLDSHKPKDIWKNDFSYMLKSPEDVYSINQFFYTMNKILPNAMYFDDTDSGKFITQFLKDFDFPTEHISRNDYYTPQNGLADMGSVFIIVSDQIHLVAKPGSYHLSFFYSPLTDKDVIDYLKKCALGYPIEELKESNLYLITQEHGTLRGQLVKTPDLKSLDISLLYNDGFKEVHEVIFDRLSTDNAKGLVLLHGLPGTGKTTYIRHLMSTIKKKFIFLSPECAHYLSDSSFIKFLLDYRNSILIIEDAEKAVKARTENGESATSNLLSLGDGLLSDSLNIQVLITMNNELSTIDEALLRKGRLIARYDFKELDKHKAQRVSDGLGYKSKIEKNMTLAEIYNQNDMNFNSGKAIIKEIGFRSNG
jgi:ATPase family protein associated with various cellular activities (AAA)